MKASWQQQCAGARAAMPSAGCTGAAATWRLAAARIKANAEMLQGRAGDAYHAGRARRSRNIDPFLPP
jgi:hypothetical protein